MKRFILSLIPATLYLHMKRLIHRLKNRKTFEHNQTKRKTFTGGYSYKPFDDTRSIFIHVPKCAGVSVNKALYGNLAGGHTTLEQYTLIFEPECLERYFLFTIVRNPWDRLVSAYHFLKSGGISEKDREWGEKLPDNFTDFVMWLDGNIWGHYHFQPQYHFITHKKVNLDFIGRFENLEEDFDYVSKKIGSYTALPKTNKSEHRDYREYYTDETRDIVGEIYRRDIELLGYRFDGDRLR